ncbi:MAG: aliphatic sulfonate ABC transporter substrate-binding protein [Chloroflexi bacterium]|nr:aliphatic sulfonate ABC transporter substrate-binding protein [Chloroflexota bacterium]
MKVTFRRRGSRIGAFKFTCIRAAVIVIALSVTSVGAAGAAGTERAADTQQTTNLTAGYIPAVTGAGVAAIGEKFGWFKEAGLNIKWVPFTSGPAQAAAMAGGSLDIEYLGGPAIWTTAKGIGKIISLDEISNRGEVVILARPDSGIKKVSDLRGQQIGYSLNGASHMLLYQSLTAAGMTFKDVKAVPMDPPTAVSAFLGGSVPAVSVFYPFAGTIIEKAPNTVIIGSLSNFANSPLPGVLAASDNLINTNPNAVKRFVSVAVRAIAYRAAHRNQTVNIVARFGKVPRGPLYQQYDLITWLTPKQMLAANKSGAMAQWVRRMEEIQVAMGTLDSVKPPESFMRLGFVNNALRAYVASHPETKKKKK